jgi:hypothetical protein
MAWARNFICDFRIELVKEFGHIIDPCPEVKWGLKIQVVENGQGTNII